MGIKDLSKVIADNAPQAVKLNEIKNYFGRKVAIDASMSIYQFLIAIRQDGTTLVNESGDTTSHLSGMFYRTIRMIENGIKPLYVFDGKPPEMKFEELNSRREKREEAEKEMAKAVEAGDAELIDKFSRRLVKVLPEHNNDCKKLLKLMGVPYVEAPCEAEAQCAALVKAGKVFATATEDMDALTFGSCVLLRHLTFSEAKKMPIKEFHLEKVLQGLELNQSEFIDLCILLGCDYCPSIRGIGPKKALELIQKHRSLEKILENLDKTKYPVPEHWPYQQCRKLFVEPETADCENLEISWNAPDVENLIDFMVKEKNFGEDRIRNGIQKLTKSRGTATQGRLDSFFTVSTTTMTTLKRKIEDDSKSKNVKKGDFLIELDDYCDLNKATTKKLTTPGSASPTDVSGSKTPPAVGKQTDVMAMLQKMYKNRLLAEAKAEAQKSASKPPPTNEADICVTVKVKRKSKLPQSAVPPTSPAVLLNGPAGAATPPEPPPMPFVAPTSPAASGYRRNAVSVNSGPSDTPRQHTDPPTNTGDATGAPAPTTSGRGKGSTSKIIAKCNIIIVTLFLIGLVAGVLIWFIIFVKRRKNDSLITTTTSQTLSRTSLK